MLDGVSLKVISEKRWRRRFLRVFISVSSSIDMLGRRPALESALVSAVGVEVASVLASTFELLVGFAAAATLASALVGSATGVPGSDNDSIPGIGT